MSCGGFWIANVDESGDIDEETAFKLEPGPTAVSYPPERISYTTQQSDDRLIKQMSPRNPKERKWIWKGYSPNITAYETQYADLINLQEHVLVYVSSGLPWVYMKDDCTDGMNVYSVASGTLVSQWVRCRILNVSRVPREEGGPLRYETTTITFTVDDDSVIIY
jgi:hypothetical protein